MTAAVLRVALIRMLQAARQPACRAQLGPRAPGVTLPGGARVPGTCFELTPAEAAADIATLLCWPHPVDDDARQLALALAQADARARHDVLRGAVPVTVGELLAQLPEPSPARAAWLQPPPADADAQAVDGLFADFARLSALPVQRLVAALVRL